ncbi:metalloprotease family protein [Natronorubrum thiooxidans]|uniref:Putative zincin peptidase n=1 Tax=Natronorubrum thiooxidans TaxID=308853 RepID=A0A1N7FCC4_9EURY|nr:metalloprotease family protein [Natronorubrum thiooxidans]SIR97973.1 Putative zincin peptidase [Natronorubrum thiooxidans]
MPADTVVLAVAIALVLVALALAVIGLGTLWWIGVQLLMLPGIVVHEFAHKRACDLVGVPVLEVAYFRFGDPSGYVRHVQPERYRQSFVISVAPFLVNTIVSLAVFFGFAVLVTTVTESPVSFELLADLETVSSDVLVLAAVLGWLGIAVGMQAFPSTGDANTLWARSRAEWRRSPIVLVGVPVVLVIYVANLLSWLWADVLYAVGLAVIAFYAVGLLLP